jgi:acyl carrier protein phosphodiesterase
MANHGGTLTGVTVTGYVSAHVQSAGRPGKDETRPVIRETVRRIDTGVIAHAAHDNQNFYKGRLLLVNYLAHTLLAGDDADLQVGGILGDFVRGRPNPSLPCGLRAGIGLHRAIDSFTDSHAEVRAARALMVRPWRRYAGILLDVWFDHCLARDFADWSSLPLEAFSERLRERVAMRSRFLPAPMRRFAAYMDRHDLPAAYADPQVIGEVLNGIGTRLSRANPLHRALPVLRAHDTELTGCFEAFFPQLQAFARHWRDVHAGCMQPPD